MCALMALSGHDIRGRLPLSHQPSKWSARMNRPDLFWTVDRPPACKDLDESERYTHRLGLFAAPDSQRPEGGADTYRMRFVATARVATDAIEGWLVRAKTHLGVSSPPPLFLFFLYLEDVDRRLASRIFRNRPKTSRGGNV